jgi:hypothetical protein
MSFVIGLVLFVAVVGALDARLPWPKPRVEKEGRP